ncbi:MAG TPA: hypothetical protein VEN81_17350 [Planctomycetota bacterium]|nr:hypothetical protein [Planctomycetota bacterium]
MGHLPAKDRPLPEGLRIQAREGYLEAEILGRYALGRYRQQLAGIAEACQAQKVEGLLLNWTALRGPIRTADRYELGAEGALILKDLKVASLVPPALLDRRKFGQLVGRNRGLQVETFTDREAALAWLLGPKKTS